MVAGVAEVWKEEGRGVVRGGEGGRRVSGYSFSKRVIIRERVWSRKRSLSVCLRLAPVHTI